MKYYSTANLKGKTVVKRGKIKKPVGKINQIDFFGRNYRLEIVL